MNKLSENKHRCLVRSFDLSGKKQKQKKKSLALIGA